MIEHEVDPKNLVGTYWEIGLPRQVACFPDTQADESVGLALGKGQEALYNLCKDDKNYGANRAEVLDWIRQMGERKAGDYYLNRLSPASHRLALSTEDWVAYKRAGGRPYG